MMSTGEISQPVVGVSLVSAETLSPNSNKVYVPLYVIRWIRVARDD